MKVEKGAIEHKKKRKKTGCRMLNAVQPGKVWVVIIFGFLVFLPIVLLSAKSVAH